MPIASTVHAWTVNKLCTCPGRQGAFRSQSHLYNSRLQHPPQSRQDPVKHVSPVLQAVTAIATERPVQQQRSIQPLASSQQHISAANETTQTSQQQQPKDLASPKSNSPVDLLDPQNYTGTSDKQRRKELVKYLSTIPESEMTPEMLRRWRISKANRGKKAWNHGRRHPPGSPFVPHQLGCWCSDIKQQLNIALLCQLCRDDCKDHSAYTRSHAPS